MKIAILASGSGTNFEALVKEAKRGYLKGDIKLLITDKEKAYVRKRAKKFKVKELFVDPENFKSRLEFDKHLAEILRKEKIGLILLAGYMRVLSPYFVRCFKNKILNIHPAILPGFKGINAIERAFRYGCKVTGVTVHFVNEGVDCGPIILQKTVEIKDNMTLAELEKKVHRLEHELYPQAVNLVVNKKAAIKGKIVRIK